MASYCVMNLKKHTSKTNFKALQAEANREYTSELDYYNDVDLSRSDQNVYLVRSDDWERDIDAYLESEHIKPGKDAVKAITAVYSGSPERMNELTHEEQIAYFEECKLFHEEHFGHVVSAVIHFDEGTPHMQILSVPVIDVPTVKNVNVIDEAATRKANEGFYQAMGVETYAEALDSAEDIGYGLEPVFQRDAKGRLKRKQEKVLDDFGNIVMHRGLNGGRALGNKKNLSRLQTEFASQVGSLYGFERGECRVDSENEVEHLTALQYKVKKAEEALTQLREAYKREAAEMARKRADFEEYKVQGTIELKQREDELKRLKMALKRQAEEQSELIMLGREAKRKQTVERLEVNQTDGLQSQRQGYTPWD